ncbi:MAG: hypothetical protein FWG10_06070 [Eubacteriaceae bacterium]|nr:hypothetical protein [Eubacteriaceae bacterium]
MARAASSIAVGKLLNIVAVLVVQPLLFDWSSKLKWGRYRTWLILGPVVVFIGHIVMQSTMTTLGSEPANWIPDSKHRHRLPSDCNQLV